MPRTLLLLEDDLQLNDTVKQFLEHHGYKVLSAYDAHQARDLLYENPVDLMLLDIKVPYQNGFDLLTELRKEGDKRPAIFITSLHGVEDVSRGFDAGCDDYIRKPFALKELLVRIEAQLRKAYGEQKSCIDIDETIRYYPEEFTLKIADQSITLKQKEAKLLTLLLENQNSLLNYEQINHALWEYDESPSAGSLRTYIKTLRAYLGKDRIETVKNVGYRFVP